MATKGVGVKTNVKGKCRIANSVTGKCGISHREKVALASALGLRLMVLFVEGKARIIVRVRFSVRCMC